MDPNKTPNPKQHINTTLLAANFYQHASKLSSKGSSKGYYDFLGSLMEDGKKLSEGAKIIVSKLHSNGLTPSAKDVENVISKNRVSKYDKGTNEAEAFLFTATGKELLSRRIKSPEQTTESITSNLKLIDADKKLLNEHKKIDQEEKSQKINNRWDKFQKEEVTGIVKQAWAESIKDEAKQMRKEADSFFASREKTEELRKAAANLEKMARDPDPKVIKDVMSKLKSDTLVTEFIHVEALKNHPSLENLTDQVSQAVKHSVSQVTKQTVMETVTPIARSIANKAAKVISKSEKQNAENVAEQRVHQKRIQEQQRTQEAQRRQRDNTARQTTTSSRSSSTSQPTSTYGGFAASKSSSSSTQKSSTATSSATTSSSTSAASRPAPAPTPQPPREPSNTASYTRWSPQHGNYTERR